MIVNKLKRILKKVLTLIISILAFFIQIAIYYFLFYGYKKIEYPYLSQIFLLGIELIGLIVVIFIYRSDMNSTFKLAWTILILLMPFIGTLIYILNINYKLVPFRRSEIIEKYINEYIESNSNLDELKAKDIIGYKLASTINYSTKYPIYKNTNTKFFWDSSIKHQELLEKLKQAKRYIFIEYFIVGNGYVLDSITEILEQKGQEGVEIKFLYDDIGSRKYIRPRNIKRLQAIPNLELVVYNRLGLKISSAYNYRDHRKVVVIDGDIAFTGGDNLADEYVHKKKRFGFWRDNAMMIEGGAVNSFILLFTEMWYLATNKKLDITKYQSLNIYPDLEEDRYVMPFGDGPTNKNDVAYDLFEAMIVNSQQYLYISTPYFVLDNAFISTIQLACKAGVDVRILVPHRPDKKLVFQMTRSHYGDILKFGGKIYEYSPGFNHAKNIISDDKYAFIGTVNCDYRSMFLHYECGCLLINDPEIQKMKEDFLQSLEFSEEISYEKWKKRPIFIKLFELLLNLFSTFI